MLKFIVFLTGILSFIHFTSGQILPNQVTDGKVLGISKLESGVNLPTIRLALNIYCLNHQALPNNLNELYQNELSSVPYLDLDNTYSFQKQNGCNYNLTQK